MDTFFFLFSVCLFVQYEAAGKLKLSSKNKDTAKKLKLFNRVQNLMLILQNFTRMKLGQTVINKQAKRA